MQEHSSAQLLLLRGGLDYQCKLGTSRIAVVPLEAPAPPLDAVVVEQDTHCLLALDNHLLAPQTTATELSRELQRYQSCIPGEVRVKRGVPLQLLAIIHDLDQTPSWREEWIHTTLTKVLAVAAERSVQRLGMPLLGSVHGRFPEARFLSLLLAAVTGAEVVPQQIWLGVPRAKCQEIINELRRLSSSVV